MDRVQRFYRFSWEFESLQGHASHATNEARVAIAPEHVPQNCSTMLDMPQGGAADCKSVAYAWLVRSQHPALDNRIKAGV